MMSWEIWDPFEDMKNMQKEMDRTFRDFFRKPVKIDKKDLIREPLIDIEETGKEVIVKAELPGVDKKDIELNLTENMLSLKAERKHDLEKKKKDFYRCERSYQSFQRTFTLPARVLPDKADAKMNNGLLTVTLKKAKPVIDDRSKIKKISIR